MLPEEVQAILGGIIFFILASFLFLSQRLRAEDKFTPFPTNSIVKTLELK